MQDPYEAATALLAAVVERAPGHGVTLPQMQYVAPGQAVAYDTTQVTVNLARTYAGQPGSDAAGGYGIGGFSGVTSAELVVCIVRDTPVWRDDVGGDGAPPSARELAASAKENMGDAVALSRILREIDADCVIKERGSPSAVGPVSTIGPEGGVVAVAVSYEIVLL